MTVSLGLCGGSRNTFAESVDTNPEVSEDNMNNPDGDPAENGLRSVASEQGTEEEKQEQNPSADGTGERDGNRTELEESFETGVPGGQSSAVQSTSGAEQVETGGEGETVVSSPQKETVKVSLSDLMANAGIEDGALEESKASTSAGKIKSCYVVLTDHKSSVDTDVYELALDEVNRGSGDPATHDNGNLDKYYYEYAKSAYQSFWEQYTIEKAIYVEDRSSLYFEGKATDYNPNLYEKGTQLTWLATTEVYSRELDAKSASGKSNYVSFDKDLSITFKKDKKGNYRINAKDAEVIYVLKKKTEATATPTPSPKPADQREVKKTLNSRLIRDLNVYTDNASDWAIQQDFRLINDIGNDGIHTQQNSEVYGNDHTLYAYECPGYLIGSEVIQTGRKDKTSPADQAEFTLAEDAYVSVAWDVRLSTPSWLSDTSKWTKIHGDAPSLLKVSTSQGTNKIAFVLLRAKCKAGEKIRLGAITDLPADGFYANYCVFVSRANQSGRMIKDLQVADTENAFAWSIINSNGLAAGDHYYGDRNLVYNGSNPLPDILMDTEYLATSCDSKYFEDKMSADGDFPEEARFTANENGTVFLALDPRILDPGIVTYGKIIAWLEKEKWIDTEQVLVMRDSQNIDRNLKIFKRNVRKGEQVVLTANGNTVRSAAHYLVFAKEGAADVIRDDDPSVVNCELYFCEGLDTQNMFLYSDISLGTDGIYRKQKAGETPAVIRASVYGSTEIPLTIPSSYRYNGNIDIRTDDDDLYGAGASFSAEKGTGTLRITIREIPPYIKGTHKYQTVRVFINLSKEKKYTVYFVDETAKNRDFEDVKKNNLDLIYDSNTYFAASRSEVNVEIDPEAYIVNAVRFLKNGKERQFFDLENGDPEQVPTRTSDDIDRFRACCSDGNVGAISFVNATYDLDVVIYVTPTTLRFQVLYYYSDRGEYSIIGGSDTGYFAETEQEKWDYSRNGAFIQYGLLSSMTNRPQGPLVSIGKKKKINMILPDGYEYGDSYMYGMKSNGMSDDNFRYTLKNEGYDQKNEVQAMNFVVNTPLPGRWAVARVVIVLKHKQIVQDYSNSHVYVWYYDIENGIFMNSVAEHFQVCKPDSKKGDVTVPYNLQDKIIDDNTLKAKDFVLKEVMVRKLKDYAAIPYAFYDKNKDSPDPILRSNPAVRFMMPKPENETNEGNLNDAEVLFLVIRANGRFGYNLNLPDARWSSDVSGEDYPAGHSENDMISIEGIDHTDVGVRKVFYRKRFAEDESITIVPDQPVSDEYTFIGWFDKRRSVIRDGKEVIVNMPTIRKSGTTLNYHTEREYTLDALWAQILTSDKEVYYNGRRQTLDKATARYSTGTLRKEYLDQLEAEGYELSEVTYSKTKDGTYGDLDSVAEVQPGRYKIYMKSVLRSANGKKGQDELAVYASSWLTINPVVDTGFSRNKVPFELMIVAAIPLVMLCLFKRKEDNEPEI